MWEFILAGAATYMAMRWYDRVTMPSSPNRQVYILPPPTPKPPPTLGELELRELLREAERQLSEVGHLIDYPGLRETSDTHASLKWRLTEIQQDISMMENFLSDIKVKEAN